MLSRFFPVQRLYGGALFLWMMVIFGFSSIRGSGSLYPSPIWYVVERKTAHVAEFCILAILAFFFFSRYAFLHKRGGQTLLIVVLFCTAYAFSDEIHQFFVFGREARFTDVLIDVCGSIVGVGIVFFWRKAIARPCHGFFLRCVRQKTSR